MYGWVLTAALLASQAAQVRVEVRSTIEASIARVAPDAASALAAQAARLLRWRGDVTRDVHPGDRLSLLYEAAASPELVALSYEGAQITLRAYRYAGADGVERFYDERGVLIEPALRNPPVEAYTQITETLQRGRGKRKHDGLDLKAPEGTPVRLPFAGTVSRVNWGRRINGNCVEVQTASGQRLRFLHLTRVATDVRPGLPLERGALLGWVGNTGRSSAPHLHYEILDARGRPLDPLRVHGTHTATLPETALPSFATLRALYDALLSDESATANRL